VIYLFLLCFLICLLGIHILYPQLLKRISIRHAEIGKATTIGARHYQKNPFVSIILPVHNEELVIERRLNNIFESSYPSNQMEIIVIDSGSSDNTSKIIKSRFNDKVTLVQEALRRGKARAVNLGLSMSNGEIVILTDGPTLYEKDTIAKIVESFDDPSIGGVTVLYEIPNDKNNRIVDSETNLWAYKDRMRLLESKVFSTSWLSGEACAFRKRSIDKIPEDSLADDSNIALQLISKGYKVIVNDRSYFTEKSPSTANDYFEIKTRRALGGLQETIRFRSFLFNRRYGYFGLLIFPYRFFLQVVSPIVSMTVIALIPLSLMELSYYLGTFLALVVALFLIGFSIFFRSNVIGYIYLQIIMLKALFLMLSRKINVLWVQSTTSRQ
jgi:cellulose synthase/poly-beta-1,6-N-acetylglucosamine synthase-like glycosyltransferase